MRIRRKDRDLPETPQSAASGDLPYDYDQEGSAPRDAVTSLISEPAHAAPEPPVPSEPESALPAGGDVAAPERAPTPPAAEAGPLATPLAAEAPPAQETPSPVPTPPDQQVAEEPAAPVVVAEAARPAVADPAHGKHAAPRAPSIKGEATDLLNGSKPTRRELPRVIAIANQKGGVGKTTTTVNLGAALAEQGYRVLVVDLDPQGNATTGLGVDARNFELSMYDVIMRDQPLEDCIEPTSVKNLFVAPATIDLAGVEIELVPAFSRELKLKRAIETVVEDFDFVLIDCPPSLGLITVNGLAAADEVMVPIQCEYYALEGLSQLLRNVNLVSTNLNETLEVTTIVLTMFDARTRLSVDVANEVREHFSERVCRVVIPRTVRLSEAPSFGQPITVFDPASRGAVAYRELAKEVSDGAPQRTR